MITITYVDWVWASYRRPRSLTQNNLLSSTQFGLQQNFSTKHAVSVMYDKLLKSDEKRLYSCCLLLNLTKAFDTVEFKKMKQFYGIRSIFLELFKNY